MADNESGRDLAGAVAMQRRLFEAGATLPAAYRLSALRRLYALIRENADDLIAALTRDFGGTAAEMRANELVPALEALRAAKTRCDMRGAAPRGVALVAACRTSPLLSAVEPLAYAVAAGCCVCVKLSGRAGHTGRAVESLVASAFSPDFAWAFCRPCAEADGLFGAAFDAVYFSGTRAHARRAAVSCAERLAPCTLRLGGASFALVDADADIPRAADCVARLKLAAAGQSRRAPTAVLVARRAMDAFLTAYEARARAFMGTDASRLCAMLCGDDFERAAALFEGAALRLGEPDPKRRVVPPSVGLARLGAEALTRETLCPHLFAAPFDKVSDALACVGARTAPALYLFARNEDALTHARRAACFEACFVNPRARDVPLRADAARLTAAFSRPAPQYRSRGGRV